MLTVNFYAVEGPNGKAASVKKGTITLNGNKISYTPATSNLMRGISLDPITVFDADDEEVTYDPKKDPEGWMRNLYLQYKSYVLQASQVIE